MTRRSVGAPPPGGAVSRSSSEGEVEVSRSSSAPEESVPRVAAGGLQLLGAGDAVVCEGDVCWVPPSGD